MKSPKLKAHSKCFSVCSETNGSCRAHHPVSVSNSDLNLSENNKEVSLHVRLPAAKFVHEEDLKDVLCEFDAVIEDFTSPVEKRHFRYDEHLKTAKRRSSASVSDSGISDSESKFREQGEECDGPASV